MEKEYKLFFDEIKKATGIPFSVYTLKGALVYGTGDKNLSIIEANETVIDIGLDRITFPIKFSNEIFIGCINGSTQAEKNYAFLISSLAENSLGKNSALSREDFNKALILGELSLSEISKYMNKFSLKDGNCSAMIITVKNSIDEVIEFVKMYYYDKKDFIVKLDDKSFVLVKFSQETSSDYRSVSEFAEYLVSSVYEELSQTIFIAMGGTVRSLTDIAISFSQASTTQRMAIANNFKRGVHSFKQYIMYRLIEDLPKYRLNEYMDLLSDPDAEEIFSDDEMLETAEEFLDSSLNQSETARKLFLHRNTLTYRLDKIENATGLNIRKFSDAITFRLITVIRKLIK